MTLLATRRRESLSGIAAEPCVRPSLQLEVASLAISATSQGPVGMTMLGPTPSRHSTAPCRDAAAAGGGLPFAGARV
jgi:hypothetical protein